MRPDAVFQRIGYELRTDAGGRFLHRDYLGELSREPAKRFLLGALPQHGAKELPDSQRGLAYFGRGKRA